MNRKNRIRKSRKKKSRGKGRGTVEKKVEISNSILVERKIGQRKEER